MKKNLMGMIAIALMMTAGCSSKTATVATTPAEPLDVTPIAVAPVSTDVAPAAVGYGFDQWQTGPLGDVFYEFDSVDLSEDAQSRLTDNAHWMQANPGAAVVIEGHCDNRGTSEYNLALGERRAATAKEYIARLGVAPSRMEIVSYGEERPFAEEDNDASWAKNRRAHFVLK